MISGLDSAKEEMDAYEAPFHARGMATLAFDGPGQGEAEYELAIRGDFEAPVKAVVDWLETRSDVDPRADRVLGRQPRRLLRAACGGLRAADQGVHLYLRSLRLGRDLGQLPPLTREAFRVRSHKATQEEAREHGRTLTLKHAARRIACPLFLVGAKLDRLIPWQHAERIAARGARTGGAVDGGGRRATMPTTGPTATGAAARIGWRSGSGCREASE